MVETVLQQVSGRADVTTDKNGVLISKDGKEGTDLIDEALKYNGQLPTNVTPRAPTQLAKPKAQANPGPRSGAQNVAPHSVLLPRSSPKGKIGIAIVIGLLRQQQAIFLKSCLIALCSISQRWYFIAQS